MALHTNTEGQCYLSRDAIVRALGVNPSTASDRIQRLLAFRWQGQPLVQVTRGCIARHHLWRALAKAAAIAAGNRGGIFVPIPSYSIANSFRNGIVAVF